MSFYLCLSSLIKKNMTTLLLILAIILVVLGIIGCIVPGLPGPALSFLAMVAYNFTNADNPFSTSSLIIWGAVAGAVLLGDMLVPAAATKKFGGTKAGVWGGIIGTFVGMFSPIPFGVIWGPLVGAIVGDLLGGKQIASAMKSGFGSFAGFLLATFFKFVVAVWIGVLVMVKVGMSVWSLL